MDFVDDEDLVAIPNWHDGEAGDDHLAHVVDARVRGCVDLEDVDVAPFGNLDARVALSARIRRWSVHAVQRPRQNARRRRLSDAARSGEDERLREPAAFQRVAQRTRHLQLSDDVVELLRPPLARNYLVGHDWRLETCDVRLATIRSLRNVPRSGVPCGTCQYPLS